jgi:phytoene desaturase
MLYFRPHNRFAPGLYLVGGGTHPGSGLPVIYEGARITTRLLLKDLGLGEAASAMHLERMPLPAGMDEAA